MHARVETPRSRSTASDWVEVGRVLRPHGVRGALSVALYGDDPANLRGAPRVRLSLGPQAREFELEAVEVAGAPTETGLHLRLRLVGVRDRDAAEALAGAALSIPESALRPLPEGEFYWRDVLGARCRDLAGRDLGRVDEIWPTRAHDVLVLRDGAQTRMVPVRQGTLVRLDRDERLLTVDLPAESEGDA